MAYIFEMPRYGANMDEGLVAEWSVEEGDSVDAGQVICVIEIEKLANEVEVQESGVVRKLFCEEGETLPCGAPLAIIAGADEDICELLAQAGAEDSAVSEEPAVAPAPESAEKAAPADPAPATAAEGSGFPGEIPGIRITPKALKLAEEMGVDYRNVRGTGILDAITRDDIRTQGVAGGKTVPQTFGAAPVAPVKPDLTVAPSGEAVPMNSVRKVTSRRMMESLTNTAQTSIMMDVDMTEMASQYGVKKKYLNSEGVKLSYTAIIMKAVAQALVNHPIIRTVAGEGDTMKTLRDINIGLAVDSGNGLTVPVLKSVDAMDLKGICRIISDLAGRAKIGTATPDELTGGCFTVSNVGMFNVKYFTPILNYPESAILGVGTLTQEPVVRDGCVQIRSILSLSLTFDHRVIDGYPASAFLNEIRSSLESAIILEDE